MNTTQLEDPGRVTKGVLESLSAVHVIDGLARSDGGPSYSVPTLARTLSTLGLNVTLRTLTTETEKLPNLASFSHTLHKPSPGPLGQLLRASGDLRRTLADDAANGAILHAHCLWLMPNVYPAWARRLSQSRAKLVHSIRGMLSPAALRISAWKKQPFWMLYQKRALEAADCLHATAEAEYEEIRRVGLRNPVAVIPNAVALPDLPLAATRERKVLSFGRLHPKKGLDGLVQAWSQVEEQFPDWRLEIVGPAEQGYDTVLRALSQSLGCRRVTIKDPIYGEDKIHVYRSAELFVLSSLNENFAITVAEALAAETPVISTQAAPWSGLETNKCGWWVGNSVDCIASALRKAMSTPANEREAMGKRGRLWMSRDFAWPRVAADMLDVYKWLHADAQLPSTVRLA